MMVINEVHLEKALITLGYSVEKGMLSISHPHLVLKIHLDLSDVSSQSPLILTLFSDEQVALIRQDQSKFPILNLSYFFPHTVKKDKVVDIQLLINRINVTLLLPGFTYDEASQKVIYRYSIPLFHLQTNHDQLRAILGIIQETLEIYHESFDRVASGSISYEELLEESNINFLSEGSTRIPDDPIS